MRPDLKDRIFVLNSCANSCPFFFLYFPPAAGYDVFLHDLYEEQIGAALDNIKVSASYPRLPHKMNVERFTNKESFKLRTRTSLRGFVRPSICPSVCRSVGL